jgi:protein CWC15
MSTAHRPTFNPARGSATAGQVPIPTASKRVRDLPTETHLKFREEISSTEPDREELKRKLYVADSTTTVPLAIESAKTYYSEDEDEMLVDSDGSESSDDETALLRELDRIKQEKAIEEARIREKERIKQEQDIAVSNPLLGANLLRRQWTDDTIFQNQASRSKKQKSGFVNDVVKSEFHKKFLNKYIA